MKSLKIAVYGLKALLLSILVISSPLRAADLVTLRKNHTPCGLYLASINNGTGVKVADLSFASIDAFFEKNPDLEASISVVRLVEGENSDKPRLEPVNDFETLRNAVVKGEVKTEQKDKYLFLVGLPWPKDEAQPILNYVNEKVAAQNLNFPPPVIGLRRPSSSGIKRVGEEIRYLLFPLSTDWAKPSEAELKLGVQSVAISSGITIAAQTALLGPAVGLPAALMNMLFSISTTLPRPVWMNYFQKHDHEADKWIKQIFMTTYFTAGVYWAGKIFSPDIANILTLQAWGLMLLHKSPSIFFQTLWRKPMEHGLSTYIEKEARAGNENEARRIAASIRRWGTIFSTNAWLVSVLYGHALFNTTVNWNMGHVALIATALGFGYLKKNIYSLFAWASAFSANSPQLSAIYGDLLSNSPTFARFGMDWNIGHVGMIVSALVFSFMERHPEWYSVENKEFRKTKYGEFRVKVSELWKKMRQKKKDALTDAGNIEQ